LNFNNDVISGKQLEARKEGSHSGYWNNLVFYVDITGTKNSPIIKELNQLPHVLKSFLVIT
jgi:hypothetical protein